jgi:4-aminobutyrate aminotransferase
MTAADWTARDLRAIARGSTRVPLVITAATGSTLTDADGRTYTDLTSGWNVANIGWGHPHVLEAIGRQVLRLPFAPSWCSHPDRIEYAERLNALLGGGYAAWCGCGGSEAVEAALKIARRATGRHAVVGFTEAYHGGTLGAMLAGGVPRLHNIDLPPDRWHRHAPIPEPGSAPPADWAAAAETVILSDPPPAAVLLEAVFTNPGVLAGDDHFYQTVQSAARKAGALLITDEIGTGFGRTGRLFAFSHFGLDPDIVVIAKAMTSGVVPMSAALVKREFVPSMRGPGFDATFGWTPLACAAASTTLDVIEEEQLVSRARDLGTSALAWLRAQLKGLSSVVGVRGYGLEMGVELAEPSGQRLDQARLQQFLTSLRARGIFAESSRYTTTLLIMPPLNIPEAELERALVVVCEEIVALTDRGLSQERG